jgi:hypothetical protein
MFNFTGDSFALLVVGVDGGEGVGGLDVERAGRRGKEASRFSPFTICRSTIQGFI